MTSRTPSARTPARRRPGRAAPNAGVRVAARKPARDSAARAKPAREDDRAPAPVLSTKQQRELRARAHALTPIVQVGHGGVHGPVIAAVRRALRDHELIKVRLHEPEDKHAMAETLATEARAALCGLIGHTVILYRPKPVAPRKPRAE